MRSSNLVMSGSREIIRYPTSRQARPSIPAPRRMRSTLYCVAEWPVGLRSASAPRARASAVRSTLTKTWPSRLACGARTFLAALRFRGTSPR